MNERQNPASADFIEEEEQEFNVMVYLARFLRFWYLFPIFIALSLVAAYFYLETTQPVYLTRATLLIKDQQKGMGTGQTGLLEELDQFGGNKLVENEIQILKSQTLMEQVVLELGLDIAYYSKDGLRTIDLYKASPIVVRPEVLTQQGMQTPLTIHIIDSTHFKFNDETISRTFGKSYRTLWGEMVVDKGVKSDYKDINVGFIDSKAYAEGLVGRLGIAQPNIKSTVLELTFEDASVQRGKDVLNKLLDVYVQSSLNDKNREASNTLKFIETRLNLITGELGDVEKDVESYKTSNDVTDLTLESHLYLENIKDNDSKLNEVSTQISILESVDNYIENAGIGAVAPATYMIQDPVLVALLTQFNELELLRQKYARTIQASNPLLETVNTQLAGTKQSIRETIQNIRRGMDMTKANLESINSRFSDGLRGVPQKEREYVGIKRQQSVKENLYLYLLQQREETALSYASTVTDSRLIDAPISSFLPIKPKRFTIWLGALAAGAVIPLLLINLIFLLNSTVQRRDEIEQTSQVAVLGEIGVVNSVKGSQEDDSIIKMNKRTGVGEQFRALRTNLQYLGDGTCRTIMLTSSVGGEGKSFVSINLAASLAFSDKKVILLGMDLRKPSLHERLKVSNNKGVTNYLVGQGSIEDLVQPTEVHPKFHVMTSGPIPPNPSELLSNGRLPVLLAALREQYDYILIDSPPYGLVTDASLIAEHADATLYLVRFNYTRRDHLKRIKELVRTKRFTNLSIVFNGVNYGTGYGYEYGYGGYGYGYYQDEKHTQSLGDRIRKMVAK